jgi:hypothetical protein
VPDGRNTVPGTRAKKTINIQDLKENITSEWTQVTKATLQTIQHNASTEFGTVSKLAVVVSNTYFDLAIYLELREQDKSRITAAKMKFIRKTAKYTWQDLKRNQ